MLHILVVFYFIYACIAQVHISGIPRVIKCCVVSKDFTVWRVDFTLLRVIQQSVLFLHFIAHVVWNRLENEYVRVKFAKYCIFTLEVVRQLYR